MQIIQPNKFTKEQANRLWEYLEEDQIVSIQLSFFIQGLPRKKEIQAIAILLIEAMRESNVAHLIPALYFDNKKLGSVQGVFRVPHYSLLTEHWKECGQCQTLTQDLTELVEDMIE